VSVSGPLSRDGDTDENGSIRFAAVRAGSYRARFSGNDVITFEREIVVRPNQSTDVDITLNPAEVKPAPPPPPAPAPPPPPAPAAKVGPTGQPRTVSIVDLAEKELIGRNQPRKENLVACSGNTRTTMVQLNQEQPQRLYEGAETLLYVVAGEGGVRIAGKDSTVGPGAFVSIPRNVPFAISRKGNRPLIMLTVLAGEPCEQAQ
jgi:mannose-6-phosphate isomerase-like protein (cupin superfamily)